MCEVTAGQLCGMRAHVSASSMLVVIGTMPPTPEVRTCPKILVAGTAKISSMSRFCWCTQSPSCRGRPSEPRSPADSSIATLAGWPAASEKRTLAGLGQALGVEIAAEHSDDHVVMRDLYSCHHTLVPPRLMPLGLSPDGVGLRVLRRDQRKVSIRTSVRFRMASPSLEGNPARAVTP